MFGMKKPFVIILGISVVTVLLSVSLLSQNPSYMPQDKQTGIDTSDGSPVFGNPNAPVTIIDFSDYQCPKCNQWVQNTKPILDQNYIDQGKVNLIFMDLAVQGPDSIKASEASYCASDQGMYWEYHDVLYDNQGRINSGWASNENLKKFASDIGLDMSLFYSCLDSDKYDDRVQKNMQIANDYGAKSTPTFVIIGPEGQQRVIEGPQPYEIFEKTIEEFS